MGLVTDENLLVSLDHCDILAYEGGLKGFRPSLQPTRNSGQAAVG